MVIKRFLDMSRELWELEQREMARREQEQSTSSDNPVTDIKD